MRLTGALLGVCLATGGGAWGFDIERTETEQKTLRFKAGAPREFELDVVNGSIRVTGADINEVRLTAKIKWEAWSEEKLAEAKKAITIHTQEDEKGIYVTVDTPWKCGEGCYNQPGYRRTGYKFRHDFEVQVPRDVAVKLKAVNGEGVKLTGTRAKFHVDSVNGGVELDDVTTGGWAHTLNGNLIVRFSRNPTENSYLKSFNGKVEAYFQPGLNANAQLKTFNGSVTTDFEGTSLANPLAAGERKDGRWRYRSNDWRGFRIGSGGPELKLESFNGNIHILNRTK